MRKALGRRKRTIRHDLFIILAVGLALPLLVTTLLYIQNVRGIINNRVIAYQKVIINQTRDNLYNLFNSVEIARRTAISKIIQEYEPTTDGTTMDIPFAKRKELIEYLNTLDNANPNINGLFVIFDSGLILSSRNNIDIERLVEKDEVFETGRAVSEVVFLPPHTPDYWGAGVSSDTQVISTTQKVLLPHRMERSFIIHIDIEFPVVQETLDSSIYQEQIPVALYVAGEDTPLFSNSYYDLYRTQVKLIKEEVTQTIFRESIEIHALIRRDTLSNIFTLSIRSTALLLILLVIAAFTAAVFFSRTITDPMYQFYLCIKSIGNGDFSPRYPSTRYRELGFLIDSFRSMIEKINRLIETIVRKEKETVEAQIEALRARINPHFLYNTLDVIRGMALEKEARDIAAMTLSLSKMFRHNVSETRERTPLKREIENIGSYLKIQSFRFGDRIKTKITIPEETKEATILPFVLQPIVENAFKHGLEPGGGEGALKIQASRRGDHLLIAIRDNGIGMDAQTLGSLRDQLKEEMAMQKWDPPHGLINSSRRIRFAYGGEFGVFINSLLGVGTVIIIKIPFVKETEDDQSRYS